MDRLRWLRDGEDGTLRVGRWPRMLAHGEAQEDGQYQAALSGNESEYWPTLCREFFGDLYRFDVEPIEDPHPGMAPVTAALDQARQLPEYQQLVRRSEGDPWACGLGAAQLANAAAAHRGLPMDDAAADDRHAQSLEEMAQQEPENQTLQQRAQAARERAQQALEVAMKAAKGMDGHGMRRALRKAVQATHAQLDEMEDAAAGLGAGMGAGAHMRIHGPRQEIMKQLRSNATLRRIAQIAGRLRAQAAKVQREKVRRGTDEVCDVVMGDELARLVPSELVALVEPDLELMFMRRHQERQLLQYELRGTEKRQRGPIVLCVDESGSMRGRRHEWAMGVALALMEVAAKQRRTFALVHFDAKVQRTDIFRPATEPVKLDRLVEAVSHFSGGGTSIVAPLARAAKLIRTEGGFDKADVVLVSDGLTGESVGFVLDELANLGASVYGVGIETEWPAWKQRLAGLVQLGGRELDGSGKVDVIFGL